MKKRLFIFGLILIICFSSFNFAFAELSSDTGYKFIDLTIADRVNSGKIPSAVYNSEAWKTISRDKIPELPPISVTSAEFSRNGLTGTVHFDGDYIITMSVGDSGASMKLMYLGEYWATNYDEDEKVYTDEMISISANPDTLAGMSSRGEEFKSIYNNSTKTWSAWERTSSTPYNGNCFNLGAVVYTNMAIHTQRAYNPDTDKKQSDYLGLSGIYNIEYPPCIEPDKPTMKMYNVDDPLPENFYLEVTNPTPFDFYLNVQNSLDSAEPIKQLSGENGVYQFNIEQLGITEAGTYYFLLFDYVGNLVGTKVLTFSEMASGKIYELNVSGYIPNAELTDNKAIVNVKSKGYENLVIMVDYVKVGTIESSNNNYSELSFDLDNFFVEHNRDKAVRDWLNELSYSGGGSGGGGGGSWEDDANEKNGVRLVYGDKTYYIPRNKFTSFLEKETKLSKFILKSVTGYHCFSVFYGETEIYSREFFYSRDHTQLPSYDDSKPDTDNGALADKWYDMDIFEYSELPDGANIIDYIKWICQCIFITITSIVKIVVNFTTACGKLARMLSAFFDFLPKEIAYMIPIGFAFCLIARFLGR